MATQPEKPAADDKPAAAEAAADKAQPRRGPEMVTVRLSHRPDDDVEVPKDELPNLRSQGLLIEEDKPAAKATSGATARQ